MVRGCRSTIDVVVRTAFADDDEDDDIGATAQLRRRHRLFLSLSTRSKDRRSGLQGDEQGQHRRIR